MANTSATGGPLIQQNQPAYGPELDDLLQPWLVALTGLPADLVRPAAPPEPGNIPAADVDWCAFWVGNHEPEGFAAELAPSAGEDFRQWVSELFSIRISFYGPNSSRRASNVSAALQIGQNRDTLRPHHIAILGPGPVTRLPELVKDQWYQRADLPLMARRVIIRMYAVLALGAASGELDNEHYTTAIEVTNP